MRILVFLYVFLALPVVASEVEARLQLQLWQPAEERGILIGGSAKLAPPLLREEFQLQQGVRFSVVHCSSLRPSQWLSYRGNGECSLFLKKEEVRLPVAPFQLPASGDYRVLLAKNREGNYTALVIPLDSETLPLGSLRFVNTTQRPVSVTEHGGKALLVKHGATEQLRLQKPDNAAVHLTIRALREGKWKIEYQRPYVLCANSRSVCLVYQQAGQTRMSLQFFSGL